MSETYTPSAIEDADWYDWLVIFNDRARDFIGEVALEPPQSEDPRAQSAKFAIAARAFNLIRSSLILLEKGEQLAFHIWPAASLNAQCTWRRRAIPPNT